MKRLVTVLLLLTAAPAWAGGLYTTRQSWSNAVQANGSGVWLYSVQAPCSAGDLVAVTAQAEVTNDLGYPVDVVVFIETGDGRMLVPAAGENVTPDMHHQVIVRTGYTRCPAAGTYQYWFYIYALSSWGSGWLTIEQGYGQLEVMVISGQN